MDKYPETNAVLSLTDGKTDVLLERPLTVVRHAQTFAMTSILITVATYKHSTLVLRKPDNQIIKKWELPRGIKGDTLRVTAIADDIHSTVVDYNDRFEA